MKKTNLSAFEVIHGCEHVDKKITDFVLENSKGLEAKSISHVELWEPDGENFIIVIYKSVSGKVAKSLHYEE